MENQFTYNLTKLWNYPNGVFMIDGHKMRAFVIPRNSAQVAFSEIEEISSEKPWVYCLLSQNSINLLNKSKAINFGSTNRLTAQFGQYKDEINWTKAIIFCGHGPLISMNIAELIEKELSKINFDKSQYDVNDIKNPTKIEESVQLSVLVDIYKHEILTILNCFGLFQFSYEN